MQVLASGTRGADQNKTTLKRCTSKRTPCSFYITPYIMYLVLYRYLFDIFNRISEDLTLTKIKMWRFKMESSKKGSLRSSLT
jgi:hypothetical protein